MGSASKERTPGGSPAASGARAHGKEEQAGMRDRGGEGDEEAAGPWGQAHAEDARDGRAASTQAAERPRGHAFKEGQWDTREEAGQADPREGGKEDQTTTGEDRPCSEDTDRAWPCCDGCPHSRHESLSVSLPYACPFHWQWPLHEASLIDSGQRWGPKCLLAGPQEPVHCAIRLPWWQWTTPCWFTTGFFCVEQLHTNHFVKYMKKLVQFLIYYSL